MSFITDFIQKSRSRGLSDEQTLQEIIKKYPEREKIFNEALKRRVAASAVIAEIIKQNTDEKPEIPEMRETVPLPPPPPPSQPLPKTETQETPNNDNGDAIEEARKRIDELKKRMSDILETPEISETKEPQTPESNIDFSQTTEKTPQDEKKDEVLEYITEINK